MENTKEPFLSPRFIGARFDTHTLPLSILEDFSALEELIFELAKQIYLDENPLRQRVPKGFTDNVELSISSIEPGSTITNILLAFTVSVSNPISDSFSGHTSYFEKARERVIDVISNANLDKEINLGPKYLNYFNRIGKNLLEDESIDFKPNSGDSAVLNREIRRKILLSRDDKYEYSEAISFNASIPSVDKRELTFKLDIEGNIIELKFDSFSDFNETILSVFNEYENNALVSVKATGIYNAQRKLIRVEEIESMDVLDPYDVKVRLNYLSKLEDKWYDGMGKAPDGSLLSRFGGYFDEYYDTSLRLPSIFPTLEGNIQLEWVISDANIFLEVILHNFSSELVVSRNNGDLVELVLDLSKESDWKIINEKIKDVINE